MANLPNRLGITLAIDGLQKIKQDLRRIGETIRSTADKATRPFREAGTRISNSLSAAGNGARAMREAISRAATRAASSLATISAAGARMSAALGRAGVAAGRGLANGISSGVRTATGAISKIGAGLAGGLIATGFGVTENAREVQSLARSARAAGTTIQKFTALAAVTSQLGMESDDLLGAMADLSEKIDEAYRDPESSIAELFKRAGISVKDTNGKLRDTADVFRDIPDALRRIKSTAERSSVATQLIAGDSEKLAGVLALTNEEMSKRIKLAAKTGNIVDDRQARAAQRLLDHFYGLTANLKGLWRLTSYRLYPAFARFFDTMSALISKNKRLLSETFVRIVTDLLDRIVALTRALFEIGETNAGRGLAAFVDIVQAAAKGASLLISKFSGVGAGIEKGLAAGIVAIRDFAAAFMIASGNESTAGQLFGKKIDGSIVAKKAINRNGITEFDGPRKIEDKDGYSLDFSISQGTFNAAKGFSGAIDGMLGQFKRLASYVERYVVPVLKDVFLALSGNDTAYRRIVARFNRIIFESDAVQSAIKRLDEMAASSDVFEFIYFSIIGRDIDREENWVARTLDDIIEAFGYFVEKIKPITDKIRQIVGGLLGTDNPFIIGGATAASTAGASWLLGAIQGILPVAEKLGGVFGGIKGAASFLFASKIRAVGGILALATAAIVDFELFKSLLEEIIGIVKGGLTEAWEQFANTFPDMAAKIMSAFQPVIDMVRYFDERIRRIAEANEREEKKAEEARQAEIERIKAAGGEVIQRPNIEDASDGGTIPGFLKRYLSAGGEGLARYWAGGGQGFSQMIMGDAEEQASIVEAVNRRYYPEALAAASASVPEELKASFEVVIGNDRTSVTAPASSVAEVQRNLQAHQRRRIGG